MNEAGFKLVNDLKIQSMMFDMAVDWETLTLVPVVKDETPFWIKNWKEKQANGDRQPNDYESWE